MPPDLPLLPTTVVGSYAHPSWFYAAKELMEADRFGPTDIEETFDDAVDRAVADQEQAGLDIISDGEMRRASFVWAFASRMTGLRDAGPLRKMGPMSLDMRSVQETTGPVGVPHGMGAVEEFEYVRARTDRHVKVPLPVDPVTGKAFRYELAGGTARLRGTPPAGQEKSALFNVRYEVTLRN